MNLFEPLWQPVAETALTAADVDDTPVNGATDAPISSNWAFDHATTALAHSITGATEIATDLADGDEVPVYDLSTTTNKKSLLSRFWTYISSKLSSYTGALTGSSLTVSGSDEPTYSAELLTSAGWTVGAGWTEAPDDTFTHTGSGGTATLVHSATIANATKYQLTYTITGRTAGTVTITFGGQTSGAVSASGAIGPTTSGTTAFTVTPTTEFNGVCVFSLKAITSGSTPRLVVKDAGGASIIEARGKDTSNTFLGLNAGAYCTTGNYNSFLGVSAGYSNTTGTSNSFVGMNAGSANTTGYQNSFLGANAGYANTTGNYNSFVGHGAGRFHADGATALTDPEGCVYIGYEARGKDNADSNSVVIGGNTPIGLGANTTVIGTSATTLTRLYGNVATGVNAPSAAFHAIKTTEQLRLGYDASNYLAATVSSTGNLTLDTTGGTIYTPDTIENTVNGGGIILKSPDGTRYRITVANGGALSVSAA